MATLDELTEEVLSHQFSAAQYDAFIRSKLNEAEQKLCAEIDFRIGFTYTAVECVAGYALYYLPSNFVRVYNVTIEQSDGTVVALKETPFTELDVLDRSATGQPERYLISGHEGDNTIRLWPAPDSAWEVQVRYYGEPGGMVDGTDTPFVPERWQDLLVRYALVKCYERENDYNSAQYHRNIYEIDKEKAKGQAQYDGQDYGQPNLVGDGRTDDLAPGMPYV